MKGIKNVIVTDVSISDSRTAKVCGNSAAECFARAASTPQLPVRICLFVYMFKLLVLNLIEN